MGNIYEPTNHEKRVIIFNYEVEKNYQAIRELVNEKMNGELSESEHKKWCEIAPKSRGAEEDEG